MNPVTIELSASIERPGGFVLDVDLTFPPDRVTALYGPSGSGKTTILRLLAGLEGKRDQVDIACMNEIWHSADVFIPPHERNIGYVFQHLNLFPHLTVEGNLEFARRRKSLVDHHIDERQVIELLDLAPLIKASTSELSGGEKQRVAIARALFSNPGLLMMDEPLGSIDTEARLRILPYLQRLQGSLDIPLIYVSHSLDEVLYLADFVHVLADGTVESSSSVMEFAADIERGATEPDAAAIIQCQVEDNDGDYSLTRVNFENQPIYISGDRYAKGDQITIRVPARDVSLTRSPATDSSIINILSARVYEIHDPGDGPSAMVKLKAGEQFLLARITRKSLSTLALAPGDSVYVQIKGVALMTDYDR